MSIKSHAIAIDVEWKIRSVLDCERFGFGGIANSDFIDSGGCYTAFASVLAVHYLGGYGNRIDEFLEKYIDLNGKRIEDDEPRFETANKELGELLDKIRGN